MNILLQKLTLLKLKEYFKFHLKDAGVSQEVDKVKDLVFKDLVVQAQLEKDNTIMIPSNPISYSGVVKRKPIPSYIGNIPKDDMKVLPNHSF